ncbi:hypothetical protein [Geodermatophilus sp. CPCC 205506]|uniref:hypothetical protein n=1 Tax=Geodermatophilus sp. CPCC 205506 TaxID=2936596 RepID=UPI003EED92C8
MTRTLAPRVLWTASAAAAVGLGLLSVAVVDADAAPDTRPASATSSQPSAPSSSSSSSSDPSSSAPAPAPPASSGGEQVTVAGTVTATCDGGALSYAGAPAPGWWLDDSPRPGEVEFENGSQKLEVKVTCVDGTPQFSVEGPRDDGRGGDDSPATTAPSAPSAPTTGRGYDDSDGRVGGGHGSDDGPGDDSAGRVGGGHGSDDGPGDDSGRGRGRGRGGDD